MALNEIYRDLRDSILNRQIDLYAAAQQKPSLAPLRAVLALFNIDATYVLTDAQLAQPGAVTLTGRGTWALRNAATTSNVSASLTIISAGGQDVFTLSLSITDPHWTFSTTFQNLPETEVLLEETGTVGYADSFLKDLSLGQPVFSASNDAPAGEGSLHLAGYLSPSGVFAKYEALFAPWPLRLEGRVTLPPTANDPPSMDLRAVSPALSFNLLGASLHNAGLNLVVVNDLEQTVWGRTSFSVVNVVASLDFGSIHGEVSVVLLASDANWRFRATFDPPAGLGQSLTEVAALLDVPLDSLVVPQGFDEWSGFGISELEFVVAAPTGPGSLPSVDYSAITLASSKEWNPPIPYVRVRDVGTRWVVGTTRVGGSDEHYIGGSVYGTVRFGPEMRAPSPRTVLRDPDQIPADPISFNIDILAYVPQFIIVGSLRAGDMIPIGDAFTYYFGNPGPPTQTGMKITALDFAADPALRTYDATAVMTMDWTVPLLGTVSITLQGLLFNISVSQGSITGAIVGQFALKGLTPEPDEDDVPYFYVGAEYTGSDLLDGWIFRGGLYPDTTVDLARLAFNFLGVTPPASLPSVQLEALSAEFATTSKRYHVAGKVVGRWTPRLFGSELNISASAAVDIRRAVPEQPAEGTLVGRFAINKIAVEVGITLDVEEPTYTFRIEFGELWISAVTGWRGEAPNRHQAITVQLGGVTLGGILEYLVNLAAPTIGYRLEPPWDILNRIELSRFKLLIDPTENLVELTYDADLDLTIMRVDKIGVRYVRREGEPSVNLVLYGQLLGKQYTDKPLSWDVVNDPPPSIGAGGETLLDVRYLGVGQRVTPRAQFPDTVRGSLDLLAQTMKPPADPSTNPLQQPTGQGLRFAADSEWLIGIDLTLLDTIDLGIIFNDPRLYGLSVGLRGERAGSFAGLQFEILYKKITDDIGMFRVELQLPEAFRRFDFGEVSVTLGVIVVEVYTNGNFLIDLGFPHERNYDRSFTVEVFPFIGRGGLYFGVLNGSTSRRVPRIANGTFAPVLEVGVGLAVGVGKEISVGPLSGGIYVQVEVIFQGVFAWFNPASSAVAPAKFYWAQGVAAIHGKLYGKVDFGVIKVSATVEAYAQASVVFEAYKPTIFRLDVEVSVEADVEILFVSVSFSFSAELDVSFTVGGEQTTPWILDAGQSQATQRRLRSNVLPALRPRPALRERILSEQHLTNMRLDGRLVASAADPCSDYVLNWNPTLAVFNSPRPVALTMLPAFSLTQVPVNWDGTRPPNPAPQYRVAFVLFAPNGVPPRAAPDGHAGRTAALSAQADAVNDLSSDILFEALLRWAIAAVCGSPGNGPATVTAGQIATLLAQMACPQTRDTFSVSNLGKFLKANAPLRISGDPGGQPPTRGGMIFPMPPPISWTSPQAGNRNFAEVNKVGPLYEWGIALYLSPYFPQERPVGPQPPDDSAAYESFASYVFRDYFLMIAKGAVQAARDALTTWRLSLSADSTLAGIANSFPSASVAYFVRAGDTVDSVAEALGASAAELEFLNPTLAGNLADAPPGTNLPIKLGVSPESVALDNAALRLTPGLPFDLGVIDYQARAGDTLDCIAQHFHLGGPAALLDGSPLADNPELLRQQATFPVPPVTYTPPAGTATLTVAATFYVRYYAPPDVPFTEWYAQTIFDLNKDGALCDVDGDGPIPAGRTLWVPPAVDAPSRSAAIPYTTVVDDTVTRVGATLSLAQNFASGGAPYPSWAQFRDAVTTGPGTVNLPDAAIVIRPRDTLNSLAARTIVNDGHTERLVGWLADSQILQPLAVVTVPNVAALSGRDGNTIGEIAAYYDLTVADFGSRVAAQTVFSAAQSPTIKHLLVQDIDTLVARVLAGDGPRQVSATTSRYFFSGLRLRAPADKAGHKVAEGPLTSLYDLTGQQFPGPSPSAPGVALEVTATLDPAADWIELVGSTVTGDDETYDALVARAPGARDLRLNPALRAERLRPGMIVHTGVINELVFSYTAGQLNYPSDGLALAPASGPAAMPLAGKNPRTYGLDHRIALQSAAALPIPIVGTAPAAGVASLWPFPAALIGRALAGVSVPYDILRSAHAGDGRDADAVQGSTYATLLPFEVSRAAGRDHLYDVRGAPDANRQTLLALRHYLTQPTTPPGTKALLLVPNAPEAANASGLVNLLTEESQTFIVKTNLSTETMSSARWRDARAAGTSGDYYASFGDLVPFVLLLWEASVVGGAGYYLNLTTTDGGDIPAGAFDERGAATLYLLVIAGEQQAPAPSGRVLLPINNCAAVAPGLDPSTHALYVEAARDEPSELVTVALVPPGNVGFTLSLPVPPTDTQEDRLRSLFSLATYEIPPGGDFSMSPSGLPAGPHRDDASLMPIWHRRRIERWRRLGRVAADDPPTPVWRFDQVLPVARFGPASAAPPVGGLPDPADDPYRGIGGTRLASADIRLGFSDVLGNITAPPATPDGAVNAVVGYTDPIAGVANWPAVTTQYEVTAQTDGTVTLTATVAPQPGAIVAAPAQSAAVAVGAAARQAEKYREPYFQLAQPNVTVSLVTSLKASPIVADGWALWRFAAASYAAAMGAASVVPKIAGGSLAEVVAAYGVTYDDLAAANADAPAASLFGVGPLAVPVFVTFADGDSAAAIVRGLGQGWPTPGSGAQLLTQNGTLPLRTGAALSIPPTPVVIQTPAPTLAALANGLGTSSSLLADDSRNDRDVLRQNFIFTMDGLTVTIGQTTIPPDGRVVNTFGEVVAAFAALGVNLTVEDLAAAFADAADMLDAGKTLHTAHYVAADGDTLEHNSSGVTVAEMAANNATTPDVFDAGALVYLGTTQGGALHGGAPETLRQFADRYACPPGQLLAANPTLVLPAGTSLVVPGSATLPNDPSALSMPYSVGEGETLAGIAVKFFGATAQTLGAANRHLPGTIAAGKAVAVGSFSTPTVANDSLQSVWQRLNQQSSSIRFEQVIDAVADAGGYLAVDSLLLCPPAQTAAGSNLTPDQIATAYHVEAVAFALSNAALLGIVAGGVTLWNRDGSVSVVTGSNDTFNAITSRFAQKGASVGVREIVVKNQDVAFIAGGALALLPPAPARLKVSLGTTVGPLPGPIVPLTTTIRIQRPAAVIDPAFKTAGQDGPVERADVTVPAPSLPTPGGPGEELTLAAFVWDFQTAFPNLRVGTGRAAGKTADLWVVDFGGDGITEVKVSPGVPMPGGEFWPRFFAPRPLYNSLVQRRGVQIRALADDGQLEPGFVPTDFQDIDVEVWARRFLADLDLFLTAPYASSVYANDGARSALDRVLAAKDTLSSAVARGLAETLVISGDPKADAGRASVVRSLEQQLKVSLSRAYDTDAVVQYDATVNSPWTRGAQLPPARLGGTAVSKPPPPAGFDDPDRVLPYTIAGAKTALDQAASFVNFLMRVPDPQRNGAVGVNLDYDFLDLEFNVTGVEGVRGYESSDWVAFFDHLTDGAPPACQTALGPTTVPIPLRNYPGLPTIIGQTARATWCDTHACDEAADPPLSQAALWTYGLTYAHEHAQQDEVEVAVTFNVQSVMRESLSTPGADVATELAKYIAVADPLWAILSGFADPQTTIPPETRAHAAMTFSTFVGDIASAWGSHWAEASDERDEPRAGLPASPSDAPAQQVYKFGVRLGYTKSEGHTYFSTLQLKKGQAQPGPGGPWPVVFYVPPDGDRVALTPGAPQGDLLIYTFPTPRPIAAADWPHINIEWPGLNVAAMQNARASLAVRRNAKLLGEGNPDTARGFLYQTNSVEAADIVSPLLTWTQQIALSGADTTGALQTAFDALFGPTTGLPLTVSIFYGYQLIQPFGDDRGVSVYLPVSLYPNQRLGPDTAATIAAATRLWDSIYRPTHAGGEWAFALTLYSQLDPAATRPLLVLDRMTYKIA